MMSLGAGTTQTQTEPLPPCARLFIYAPVCLYTRPFVYTYATLAPWEAALAPWEAPWEARLATWEATLAPWEADGASGCGICLFCRASGLLTLHLEYQDILGMVAQGADRCHHVASMVHLSSGARAREHGEGGR